MLKSSRLTVHQQDSLVYIGFPKLEATKAVRVAFTTRMGGVSRGQYASMNMSTTNGDNLSLVKENYKIICGAVDIDHKNVVLSHQTHTDNIRTVTESDRGKGLYSQRDYDNVDGLITNISGVALVTQFADCTPLLFLDPVKRVIANVHSGWRGTVKQIGAKAVRRMEEEFGCNPSNIIAAIGPCIGKCCYEVDTPVYSEFEKVAGLDLSAIFTQKNDNKYMLDLWEANRQILINAGIKPENIDVTDLCTHCHSEYFHSHRATGGKRGNLAAIISLV